ncbi:MAG: hypothetical protein ACRDKW_07835 [Actinomycetota bacterium]
MTRSQKQEYFNTITAPKLAGMVGVAEPWRAARLSRRFAYFADQDRLVVVAGEQEASDVDLALAYGLTWRAGRHLVLVLPEELAFATLQRAPWLRDDARPTIWLHDGKEAWNVRGATALETTQGLKERLGERTPVEEFSEANMPLHLNSRAASVFGLVEWATSHPALDNAHRQGERAWHCRGQKVLRIVRRHRAGIVEITAGIHGSGDRAPFHTTLGIGEALEPGTLADVQAWVAKGIEDRLHGSCHRPDEHWLQSVIRTDPSLVGVEQPALREVPAWRPKQDATRPKRSRTNWSRGYLDLAGLDGHGNIRLVETKLAKNQDPLLVFQGLDYYVWAQAYEEALHERLGAHRDARLEIHYVIGEPSGTAAVKLSRFAEAQIRSLDRSIPWRFHVVAGWFDDGVAPQAEMLAESLIPR